MWSFFSRDVVKDFGYELGEELQCEHSIWRLYNGKKKATGEAVSIFTFDVASSEMQVLLEIAKAAVKRLKTLRHPSILTYLDSLETDKLVYLVTEKVEPLSIHLSQNAYSEDQKNLAISWGLYQIASGLGFLNKDCNLSHNNVCQSSVFVDHAGEWCLFGLEYIAPCQDTPPSKFSPHLKKYNPPELEISKQNKVHNWSYDSWGLGCLIWEIFNGLLPKTSSLKALGKIPSNLASCYCELVCANPLSRPSSLNFLQKGVKGNGFFKNKFVETMLFLQEMHIKDNEEKIRFFNHLSSALDTFPQNICLYKVLPELINAFEFGNAGSSVLSPMFKLGKQLSEEEYQQKIVPCVVKMFSSKDRATRAKLLQQMEEFIHHLQPAVINSQIFPNVAQGFLDTSPVIREYTIKCMMYLAPKLNYQNLNEEMLKHFARLQAKDEQGGIRTNTTVCLGKLASYLHPQTRKKILMNAFLRALRDPFAPARTAAILAFSATENYYSINDCATRVLPALCHFTIDPEKTVRDQAFKAIGGFLQKLEKLSENPNLAAEMEEEMQSMTPSAVAASWTSWAVTSLVDKLHMPSLSRSASAHSATSISAASTVTESKESKPPVKDKVSHSLEKIEVTSSDTNASVESSLDVNEWNTNDWEDIEDESGGDENVTKLSMEVKTEGSGEWDVDDWESFEPVDNFQQETSSRLSSYFSKDKYEDPFTSGIVDERESKASPNNLQQSSEGWDVNKDQWDNWGIDASSDTAFEKNPERHQKSEENRLAREEKRRQRVKERQLAKPKKLGAQKIS